jgi:hypothetical protein
MGSDECAVCGGAADQGFECSYCGAVHCTAHRLPESHSCPGDPKSPTTAIRENEPDSDSNTQQGTTVSREDPAEKIERVTTASPASGTGDDNVDQDIAAPREPTFEASSPDLNPDGSLAADDTIDSNEPNQPHPSNQLSTTRRLYYKLRATVRAPFGLLREYMMPLLVIVVLLAVVVGLLIAT